MVSRVQRSTFYLFSFNVFFFYLFSFLLLHLCAGYTSLAFMHLAVLIIQDVSWVKRYYKQ